MYPNVLLRIDGTWTESAGKKTLEVLNPATGKVNGLLSLAGIPDLDRALAAADRGFALWRGCRRSTAARCSVIGKEPEGTSASCAKLVRC